MIIKVKDVLTFGGLKIQSWLLEQVASKQVETLSVLELPICNWEMGVKISCITSFYAIQSNVKCRK